MKKKSQSAINKYAHLSAIINDINNVYGKESEVENHKLFNINMDSIFGVEKINGEFYNHETDLYYGLREGLIVRYCGQYPKSIMENGKFGFTIDVDKNPQECFIILYNGQKWGHSLIWGQDCFQNFENIKNGRIDDGFGNYIQIYEQIDITKKYGI